MQAARSFSAAEMVTALSGALLVQGLFVLLMLAAGAGKLQVKAHEEEAPREIPMAVKPLLDDELPLLKLGGKAPKLPDAWEKKAAVPVPEPNLEGAPSPKAKDDPAQAANKPLPRDAGAPPPVLDAGPSAPVANNAEPGTEDGPVSEVVGPGDPNGSPEGTETDPLKARAIDQYRKRLMAWFNARFKVPAEGQIPCAELKTLSSAVSATVGPDRSVRGFRVTRPSGNAAFDARVQSTMESTVGLELPPPPPNYPELDIGSVITPTFSGAGATCVVRGGDAKQTDLEPVSPGGAEPKEPESPKPPSEPKPTAPGGNDE